MASQIQSNSFPRNPKEGSQSNYYTYCTDLPSELDSGSLISYTSLKDLIPSSKRSKNNPYSKELTIQSAYEIPITNLLVKKAARIYLQSMPALLSPESSTTTTPKEHILCFAWGDVNCPVKACIRFIQRNVINKIASAFETQ